MNLKLWYNDEHFEPDIKAKFQLFTLLVIGRSLSNSMFLTIRHLCVHNKGSVLSSSLCWAEIQKSIKDYVQLHSQGNGPIRHVETCPDFFFHCKSTHNKIHCQNFSC
jgi:hypothetical protein